MSSSASPATLDLDDFSPTASNDQKSRAYVALASILSTGDSKNSSQTANNHAVDAFLPLVLTKLRGNEKYTALDFLAAVFDVHPQTAVVLFADAQVQNLFNSVCTAELQDRALAPQIANLLSSAASHTQSRTSISESMSQWLRSSAGDRSLTPAARAAATTALVKLASAAPAKDPNDIGPSKQDALFASLRAIVLSAKPGPHSQELLTALEGFSYLSLSTSLRTPMCADRPLLTALFSVVPKSQSSYTIIFDDDALSNSPKHSLGACLYALTQLVSNLSAYPAELSSEEKQLAKLRKMALGPNATRPTNPKMDAADAEAEDLDPNDTNVKAAERCKLLLEADAAGVLGRIVKLVLASKSTSTAILSTASVAFSALSTPPHSRGLILQQGGFRTLLSLCSSLGPSSSSTTSTPSFFNTLANPPTPPHQACSSALARILISTPPIPLLGPSLAAATRTTLPDVLPHLAKLLWADGTGARRAWFESLLALTNIASLGDADLDVGPATAVAQTPTLLPRVESLLLDADELVRRAACELVCNLVCGSEYVFGAYAGWNGTSSTTEPSTAIVKAGSAPPAPPVHPNTQKIHTLLALALVDDVPTQRAASGAIAALCSDEAICRVLIDLGRRPHSDEVPEEDVEDSTESQQGESLLIRVLHSLLGGDTDGGGANDLTLSHRALHILSRLLDLLPADFRKRLARDLADGQIAPLMITAVKSSATVLKAVQSDASDKSVAEEVMTLGVEVMKSIARIEGD